MEMLAKRDKQRPQPASQAQDLYTTLVQAFAPLRKTLNC